MTERGRNRLVGAVILLSLAVILLPMLFDGAGIERRNMAEWPAEDPELEAGDDALALQPDADVWAFAEEVEARRSAGSIRGQPEHRPASAPDAASGDDPGPETDPETDQAQAVTAAAAAAGLDARGLPRAFSVQLAAFREQENARALRQRLLDDGYDAYVLEESGSEGAMHRVAVGPRIDRAAAVRLQEELAERYELEGLVVQFTIASSAGRQDD